MIIDSQEEPVGGVRGEEVTMGWPRQDPGNWKLLTPQLPEMYVPPTAL